MDSDQEHENDFLEAWQEKKKYIYDFVIFQC